MPEIFRERGFRFFFYSNEGDPREPVDIHVEMTTPWQNWLHPYVYVAYSGGYNARTLCWLIEIVVRNRFDEDSYWVDLSDGRVLGVPLAWFPTLLNATPEQQKQVRMSTRGLHWEALDEDISIAGLLAGLGDQTNLHKTHAA